MKNPTFSQSPYFQNPFRNVWAFNKKYKSCMQDNSITYYNAKIKDVKETIRWTKIPKNISAN